MSEKRKRGQNFSLEDKDKLIKLIMQHKDTILNKKTDGTTNEAKLKAWNLVTDQFNSSSTSYRSKESLTKVWEKLKSESKIYYTMNRRSITKTGGGPHIIKTDPILEQVCGILGRGCTGILGVLDSDCLQESLPKVICEEHKVSLREEVELLSEVEATEVIQQTPDETVVTMTNNKDDEIKQMPLWSRRRPRISKINERSYALTELYASFKEVNKKKESIEDLKLKLLEDEIQYKNKIQDIQLKIAMKELEIKSTVLKQLRAERS